MNEYPFGPATGRTDTSNVCANKIAPIHGKLKRMTLFAICEAGANGLTAQDLAERTAMDLVSVQPRTSELKALGLIRDSGKRRPNRRGNPSIVWVAVNNEEATHG